MVVSPSPTRSTGEKKREQEEIVAVPREVGLARWAEAEGRVWAGPILWNVYCFLFFALNFELSFGDHWVHACVTFSDSDSK